MLAAPARPIQVGRILHIWAPEGKAQFPPPPRGADGLWQLAARPVATMYSSAFLGPGRSDSSAIHDHVRARRRGGAGSRRARVEVVLVDAGTRVLVDDATADVAVLDEERVLLLEG